jgi:hypothetical protein
MRLSRLLVMAEGSRLTFQELPNGNASFEADHGCLAAQVQIRVAQLLRRYWVVAWPQA